jgi:hypothetical protein
MGQKDKNISQYTELYLFGEEFLLWIDDEESAVLRHVQAIHVFAHHLNVESLERNMYQQNTGARMQRSVLKKGNLSPFNSKGGWVA